MHLRQQPDLMYTSPRLFLLWDQLGVVHYELLIPNETITSDLYRAHLMCLSQLLEDRRLQYGETHA